VFNVYPEQKYKKASYRNIAAVLGIETNAADVAEFVRRLVFSVLIGNADMHLKNWSLVYPDGRAARLAPAYDFVSTIPYIPDDAAALKFSRSKRMDEFTLDELRHLADKARLPAQPVLDAARDTVQGFTEVWQTEKAHLPLSAAIISFIDNHLQNMPLLREIRG